MGGIRVDDSWSGCRHPARPENARCDGCPLSERPWWLLACPPPSDCPDTPADPGPTEA